MLSRIWAGNQPSFLLQDQKQEPGKLPGKLPGAVEKDSGSVRQRGQWLGAEGRHGHYVSQTAEKAWSRMQGEGAALMINFQRAGKWGGREWRAMAGRDPRGTEAAMTVISQMGRQSVPQGCQAQQLLGGTEEIHGLCPCPKLVSHWHLLGRGERRLLMGESKWDMWHMRG